MHPSQHVPQVSPGVMGVHLYGAGDPIGPTPCQSADEPALMLCQSYLGAETSKRSPQNCWVQGNAMMLQSTQRPAGVVVMLAKYTRHCCESKHDGMPHC